MSNIYESWVEKVISQWKTRKQAQAIIQAQFEKTWIFKPWTQDLTTYGRNRNSMSQSERAITRVSKSKDIPAYKLKYIWWRVLLKNLYKK